MVELESRRLSEPICDLKSKDNGFSFFFTLVKMYPFSYPFLFDFLEFNFNSLVQFFLTESVFNV